MRSLSPGTASNLLHSLSRHVQKRKAQHFYFHHSHRVAIVRRRRSLDAIPPQLSASYGGHLSLVRTRHDSLSASLPYPSRFRNAGLAEIYFRDGIGGLARGRSRYLGGRSSLSSSQIRHRRRHP